MSALLAACLLYGQATFYAPGVFEDVWHYREHQLAPCAECSGYAATNDCRELGRKIWVYNPARGEWAGPLHVVDCATPGEDAALRARQDRIVEVDYDLAMKWGMRGPIPVWLSTVAPEDLERPADLPLGYQRTASR